MLTVGCIGLNTIYNISIKTGFVKGLFNLFLRGPTICACGYYGTIRIQKFTKFTKWSGKKFLS